MDSQRHLLAKHLVQRSYVRGDFVLASGRRSEYYFDCRLTTCFAEAMPLIGRAFLAELERLGVQARSVGGLTSGSDPIAAAVALCSMAGGRPIDLFSVRKERKAHGMRKWVEGCPVSPAAVVDDVATSGKSVVQAIERCREEGLEVAGVVVLVDREEGGMDAIRAAAPGVPVSALFARSQLDALRASERGEG
ncbi:MAG TPA: orotate phosphoribosyltransferase [Myxococcota bacterium]|nr:orotate phosphoribosyltransferase [Myxococcota bacterium]